MHVWCDAGKNRLCESGCCRSCPGAPLDQHFTSDDVKWMPCGIGEVIAEYRQVKPSSNSAMSVVSRVTTGHHVNAKVHELRADAVKVRRPRVSGVGAKRRTLHGVEHSSTLTNVTAEPVRPVRRSRSSGG